MREAEKYGEITPQTSVPVHRICSEARRAAKADLGRKTPFQRNAAAPFPESLGCVVADSDFGSADGPNPPSQAIDPVWSRSDEFSITPSGSLGLRLARYRLTQHGRQRGTHFAGSASSVPSDHRGTGTGRIVIRFTLSSPANTGVPGRFAPHCGPTPSG